MSVDTKRLDHLMSATWSDVLVTEVDGVNLTPRLLKDSHEHLDAYDAYIAPRRVDRPPVLKYWARLTSTKHEIAKAKHIGV